MKTIAVALCVFFGATEFSCREKGGDNVHICELRFEAPDPHKPVYSLLEFDAYARIPRIEHELQRRLTLRKNLATGKFEALRHFWSGREEVAFEGGFEDALRFINREKERWWGRCEPEEPCRHQPPESDPFCPVVRCDKR